MVETTFLERLGDVIGVVETPVIQTSDVSSLDELPVAILELWAADRGVRNDSIDDCVSLGVGIRVCGICLNADAGL